ncbi:hypothetical protein V6N13_015346 [Hibiscus sabdariffa]|uniref:Uncharacterized protein n=1 Tax=Hibiscus sabdariffa TaxID=183260 RepID=A0ABR2CVD1_9ROSI
MLEANILMSGFMESTCSSIVYRRYPVRSISYSGPHVHGIRPLKLTTYSSTAAFTLMCYRARWKLLPFLLPQSNRVPKADAEVCASYSNVYWRTMGITNKDSPSSQVSEYGSGSISMFTTHCLECQGTSKGAGT